MADSFLKIIYRDGRIEKKYVENYDIRNGCLYFNIKYLSDKENWGEHYIPLDLIDEWVVQK